MNLLNETLQNIKPLHENMVNEAWQRLDNLAKLIVRYKVMKWQG